MGEGGRGGQALGECGGDRGKRGLHCDQRALCGSKYDRKTGFYPKGTGRLGGHAPSNTALSFLGHRPVH